MQITLSHITSENHSENFNLLHWVTTNKPLLAVFIIGLIFLSVAVLLSRNNTKNTK